MAAAGDRIRQVLRRLGRAPLFTALTLITLSLGIGATTVIFSVVDGVLLTRISHAQFVDCEGLREEKGVERPSFLCHNYVVNAWLWPRKGRPF
jgi:hypothetical protein